MYKISTLVYQIAGLAPAPEYEPLLREFLRKPQDHLDAILGIVRCDVGLTASILRCCNAVNSYYGTEYVGILEEAEVRLGLDPIVDVITKLVTKEVYQLPREAQIHLAGLWDHSLLTGILTRRLADHCPDPAELAFTAGLLHDIGKLFIIKVMPRLYSETLAAASQGQHKTCAEQEREDFETTHARIGAEVLERWKLPRNLVNAISRHHHPLLNATQYPLAGCIALADTLAHNLEQNPTNLDLCLKENTKLLRELSLDSTEVTTVLQEGQTEYEEIKRQVTSDPLQPLSES